jgi:hypothetical protein
MTCEFVSLRAKSARLCWKGLAGSAPFDKLPHGRKFGLSFGRSLIDRDSKIAANRVGIHDSDHVHRATLTPQFHGLRERGGIDILVAVFSPPLILLPGLETAFGKLPIIRINGRVSRRTKFPGPDLWLASASLTFRIARYPGLIRFHGIFDCRFSQSLHSLCWSFGSVRLRTGFDRG